ncbi:uncharacterized protein LOC124407575 isoform X2 [Diprion similis]|uniref:uncharacterized protein LOC124407575 isoform X2 n=1 Tax=Diprion similis TaxID=362088 RepID=UPI001EF7E143|nr:uncharacterized protein LOC124407575 isoform X2 [Diprion similis]
MRSEGCVEDTELDNKIASVNLKDKKVSDVLTNVGSISKSLQLIGEAYISEDSQETDEKDESPTIRDVSLLSPIIEEQKTIEVTEPEQEASFNDVLTETSNNETEQLVYSDIPPSPSTKSTTIGQECESLEDEENSGNTHRVLADIQDTTQSNDLVQTIEPQVSVNLSDDHDNDQEKQAETNMQSQKNTEKSSPFYKITSLPDPSIIHDTSNPLQTSTTMTEELIESEKNPSQEIPHAEDKSLKPELETIDDPAGGKILKLEISNSPDGVEEKIPIDIQLIDKAVKPSGTDIISLESSAKIVLPMENLIVQNPKPVKVAETSSTIVSTYPEVELKSATQVESEMKFEHTEIEKEVIISEPILDNNSELSGSKTLGTSSSSEHLRTTNNFANNFSESVTSPVEVSQDSHSEDDQSADATAPAKTVLTNEDCREVLEVEELSQTIEEKTSKPVGADVKILEGISPIIRSVDNKENEYEDESSNTSNHISSIEENEETVEVETCATQKDGPIQQALIENILPITQESQMELKSNISATEHDISVDSNKEKPEEGEDSNINLMQSGNESSVEVKIPACDIVEANEVEKLQASQESCEAEKTNFVKAKVDSVISQIARENLIAQRDCLPETKNVDLPDANLIDSRDDVEPQAGSEIIDEVAENAPGSKVATSEDTSELNVEISNSESVECKDDPYEPDIADESLNISQVVEAKTVNSNIPICSKICQDDMSVKHVSKESHQSEETESITVLPIDTENKHIKDAPDKCKTEIGEMENIKGSCSEIVIASVVSLADWEDASETSTLQDWPEMTSCSELVPEHNKDESKVNIKTKREQSVNFDVPKIQQEAISQSETSSRDDDIQCQGLSSIITHQKLDSPEIQVENSEAQSEAELIASKSVDALGSDGLVEDSGQTQCKADLISTEHPVDEICDSQISMQEIQANDSKSELLENESKLSETERKLEENLLPTKYINASNPEVTSDISSSIESSKFNQILDSNLPGIESEENLFNVTAESVSDTLQSTDLIEYEEKVNEDLKCEPIEELEKLTAVADEILIDELADSVLKDDLQPLENLNHLEILPDSNLSPSSIVSSDPLRIEQVAADEFSGIKDQPVSLLEDVNKTCFIEDSNQTPNVSHGADYITDVIISSTNIDNIQLADNIQETNDENINADEFKKDNGQELKASNNSIPKDISPVESMTSINEACKTEDEENLDADRDIEINLPLKQEEEKLIECAVLRVCDVKIDLPDEVLFDTEDAAETEVLCNTSADNVDTSQQSSEISELECAVKFLQESEEQTIDSPLLLSPKVAEDIVEENSEQSKSCVFLSETEVCQDTLELPVELEQITPNSIAISEAEIISEAAKLENERKLKIAAELSKTSEITLKLDICENLVSENNSEMLKNLLTVAEVPSWRDRLGESIASTSEKSADSHKLELPENNIRRSEKIPKISILEERLKEPPKIEIPSNEITPRILDTPTTPKTSLLIQRDSKVDSKSMYQKMLESPKGGDKTEPRISDTPRKDSEKHDFENVGSPRIILKIAKSAIADCSEPRSPKSPKIRSAANSPNPEDSPGQKLGKIKLKLSRGGHPSIISNDNYDESTQRHMDAVLSPSHIGMKIKLSKSGDASIIQPEKYDSTDEVKEGKHKFDEVLPKRIESPLGMKIKLSKTGDPSIVQQESKDSTPKRNKEKVDNGQEIPKRTDSPIGMKIKLSKSGDASIVQPEKQEISDDFVYKDKCETQTEIPKRTESPIGMKIKLSKSGDASIISTESCEESKDSSSKSRDKLSANQDIPKRTDSPLGMKFKLSKSGGASIIQPEKSETADEFKDEIENIAVITRRVESPIGMKIKLSKTGDASIIHPDKQESDEYKELIATKYREKSEVQEIQKRTDSPIGMRIKVTKSGEATVVPLEISQERQESAVPDAEIFDAAYEVPKPNESPIGMKIKLSKTGDASIIHPEKLEYLNEPKDNVTGGRGHPTISQEVSKSLESPLGMKIKLSKTGDASIIHPEVSPESKEAHLKRAEKFHTLLEGPKRTESPLGMKIKLSKTGDASIIEPDKKEKAAMKQKEKLSNIQEVSQKRKEMEFPIEMKIKLSKTGHPTIIANEKQESFGEMPSKSKDHSESVPGVHYKRTEPTSPTKDSQMRIFKTGHSSIIHGNRSELTIEPIQMLHKKVENAMEVPSTCQDVTISPVDVKKSKLEAKLSHRLPEVTIQPVMSGEQKQVMLDKKTSAISRQQMSVINQEISITHVSPPKPTDLSMSGKLKEILRKNASSSPPNSDCEIIEHRPELIIVNENSNSSQDVMIIEEVKVTAQEIKIPRKRGRPKRSTLPPGQPLMRQIIPQDPLALDNMPHPLGIDHKESDRPKRTCRNQKSYAPPKRGRGRGRGKRKMDRIDCAIGKIPRLEDPLTEIERSTMSLIDPLQQRVIPTVMAQTSELYRALKQSPTDRKRLISETIVKQGFPEPQKKLRLQTETGKQLSSALPLEPIPQERMMIQSNVNTSDSTAMMISEMLQRSETITAELNTEQLMEGPKSAIQESKNIITDMTATENQNWLTPSIKLPDTSSKSEAISIVQVIDEETRMSAESNSRSQTPARNISIPAVETVINEESQGSVLSTATTESEKVKVKNRRMEINFDPDEGPFTVDKIAEYEWPLDKKGETFMIQEQISQYLGVKSFKRKYPDLKRRMVEMEERNYLRENCLVSEAMCDMGLTAICSTEVLDVMCSDFPDQYEEYRKHMREKQAKEHSKKQKELTAAANAERNRIDLAEMAVQSALSWNVNFNKARKESRKYSLDLQSFTIHVPKKQQKVDVERKVSNYPVALIPGQYTDYYREYTPAELRYYPLNTVLYGPMKPNERKFDSQSEGSQSDSDSDSSSDDSSSSSSEGTQDTEESQSTVDEVDMELGVHKEDNKNLKCKMCLKHLNKHGKAEVLIQCGTCNGNVHPSCIDLTLDMVPHIQGYSWQCTDCKTCVQCHNPADEDKMLFCDMCDRGYHIYCVGLRRVPQGRWHCRECAVCASCGLRTPGGANSDRNSVAQWQHEYKKGERNTRVYVSTLCVPCSKMRGNQVWNN